MTIHRRKYSWGRAYVVSDNGKELILPSVTTVLKLLENQKYIKMQEDLGYEMYSRILDNASDRGSIMHRMLELFLLEWGKSRNIEKSIKTAQEYAIRESKGASEERIKIINRGRSLFWNFYHDKFWEGISEIVGNEIFLWTVFKGGWAGATDFVFRDYMGRLIVDDFKSSTSMKDENEILGYKIQICCYMFMCAEKYGEVPYMGRVRVSNEINNDIQTFIVYDYEIKEYLKIFLDLLKKFREEIMDFGNYTVEEN